MSLSCVSCQAETCINAMGGLFSQGMLQLASFSVIYPDRHGWPWHEQGSVPPFYCNLEAKLQPALVSQLIVSSLPFIIFDYTLLVFDSGTMENGKKKREERKLTEAVLKLNGIEFDEKVERDKQGINEYFLREGSHSQQAWVVTEGLLDFDGILSPSNFVSSIFSVVFGHLSVADMNHQGPTSRQEQSNNRREV